MSKKSIILLIICCMIIGVISFIFIINNNKSNDNEQSISRYRNINTGDFQDIKLLPYDYMIEQAKEDGCIVQDENDVYNVERFKIFLDNVNNNKNDYIRIVDCYNNKASTIMDINYDNVNSNFILCFDSTRHENDAQEDKKYSYYIFKNLVEEKTKERKFYKLKNLVQEMQKEQREYYPGNIEFSITILQMSLNI